MAPLWINESVTSTLSSHTSRWYLLYNFCPAMAEKSVHRFLTSNHLTLSFAGFATVRQHA